MENQVAWIIAVILIIAVFTVFVLRNYKKKLKSGCCGTGDTANVRKVKISDKNKSNYPYKYVLNVDGMVCSACKTRVENTLNTLPGIWASADLSTKKVTVLSKEETDLKVLKQAVHSLNVYTVVGID